MPPDPVVLAFDTSAAHCAAALLFEGQLTTRIDPMARGQAEHLMPMLNEVLSGKGLGWHDMDVIGVGVGPGNFTGVRISVSAARGLALGLRVKAVGVSTLEAQAFGVAGPVISAVPAPRDRAYVQGFNGVNLAPRLIALDDPAEKSALQATDAPLCGANALELAQKLGLRTIENDHRAIDAMAQIAAIRAPTIQDRPKPLYLRPADAAPARNAAPVLLP